MLAKPEGTFDEPPKRRRRDVSVSYASGFSGGELEPLVESPGNATPGQHLQVGCGAERWAFNLSTKPYTAAGTYAVTAMTGAEDYVLDPDCSNTFVRQ